MISMKNDWEEIFAFENIIRQPTNSTNPPTNHRRNHR